MAIMHPNRVYQFNTYSEKQIYEALRDQLSDKYEVFYSVSWHGKDEEQKRVNSEADFIIVDQQKGFLCVEVKGGISYLHEGDKYIVKNADGSEIVKKKSAFDQAKESMYYFHDIFQKKYECDYHGVYGFIAAFPNYELKDRAREFFQVPEVIIDQSDMDGGLETAIRKAFTYWQGRNKTATNLFVDSSKKKLCDMFRMAYSLEASKGAMIEAKREELDRINNTQDSIINLLSEYKSYAIKGAAGTGKSWIAFKMALSNSMAYHRRTLLLSKSSLLAGFFRKQLDIMPNELEIIDYQAFIQKYGVKDVNNFELSENEKYSTIIVDEAQDFSDEEAVFIRTLLDDDPAARINIFYDDEQDLNGDKNGTPKKFCIDTPPYILTENLRNTKNIYEWAKERTSLGEASFSNQIDGIEPIFFKFNNENQTNQYLKNEIGKLLTKDALPIDSINMVIDDDIYNLFFDKISSGEYLDTGIKVFKTKEYKGLESNVVIYVHRNNNKYEYKYVGLTRARFVLYDIEVMIY